MGGVIGGLNAAVEQALASLDLAVVSVRAVREGERLPPEQARRREALSRREGEQLRRSGLFEALSLVERRQADVGLRGQETRRIEVCGTGAEYAVVHDLAVVEGRFLGDHDVRAGRPVVVIGAAFARRLFGTRSAVGEWLEVDGSGRRIVGVLAPGVGLFGEVMQDKLFVPLGSFGQRDSETRVYEADVLGRHADGEAVAEDVRRLLRRARHLAPHEPDTFAVYGSELVRGFYERTTRGVFAALAATSSLGLLVGGIGLMNVMLIGVRQRAREIGVRRAVGATRADVFVQFLSEALLLSAAGGAAGVALGLLFVTTVRVASPLAAQVPWPWLAAAVALSFAIGLVFGSWPAARAARLDPALALQHE
jgi:putative ABC transport system permease protein